jgi:endo-1,4-beta-xylanase
VSRYAGRVGVWDVVNEPISNEDDAGLRDYWVALGGADAIARMFEAARAANPTARLYLNDYDVEHAGAKSEAYYRLAADLKSRGLLDGVGFQAHLSTQWNNATAFRAVLQRFADLGLEVAVTELDVRVPMAATQEDLAKQRLLFERATNACLAVSRCVSVTVWGFTDAYSWANADGDTAYGNATLYDTTIEEKGTYWTVHGALADRDVDTQAVAGHSGKCLHVVGGSAAPGAHLQQYTCTGSPSQVFHFRRLGVRTYQITNAANGLCLGVEGASTSDLANLIQERCIEGAAAQTFVLRPAAGDGTGDGRQYQIVAQHSGKCVEVYGGNLTNSGWVEQSACHAAPALTDNQVWTVTWGHL